MGTGGLAAGPAGSDRDSVHSKSIRGANVSIRSNGSMSLLNLVKRAVCCAPLALLASCGDSTGAVMVLPPPSTTIQADPPFQAVVQEIFERRGCAISDCHGTRREGDLDLRSGSSYDNLINLVSAGENVIRVIPGNAGGSYLVIKLEDRQSEGDPMPFDSPVLDPVDLAHIRNWINQGAKRN
jgi:hypothetical protein